MRDVLEGLTVERFAPAVGDAFALHGATPEPLRLTLEAARPGDSPGQCTRAPFSLSFRGPAEPVLPQRIYRLEHAGLGTLEIFLVPVAHDATGTEYEAVFG
jgi:hypothetical protein